MTRALRTSAHILLSSLACVALLSGCRSAAQFAPQVQDDGKFLVHIVVSPKEEIGPLCVWYSGDASCERVLAQENPGVNLSSLKVGDRILVPFSILKRVERYQPGVKPPPQGAPNAPTAAAPPEAATADSDPLEGENFRELPQGTPTASAGNMDPLEQLMRNQEQSREKQAPPTAEPAAPTSAETPALETFDLRDEEAGGEGAPQKNTPPTAERGSSARRAPQPEPAEAPHPIGQMKVDEPTTDPEVEGLRRELGLAN